MSPWVRWLNKRPPCWSATPNTIILRYFMTIDRWWYINRTVATAQQSILMHQLLHLSSENTRRTAVCSRTKLANIIHPTAISLFLNLLTFQELLQVGIVVQWLQYKTCHWQVKGLPAGKWLWASYSHISHCYQIVYFGTGHWVVAIEWWYSAAGKVTANLAKSTGSIPIAEKLD